MVGVAQSSPNGEATFVRLYAPPTLRCRGIGSALLAAVRDAHPGAVLKGITVAGQACEQFATTLGATVLMRLVVLAQRLSDLDTSDAALPEPYRLVFWRVTAPDELVDSYAQAYCHLADAPGAHHQIDNPRYDRNRVPPGGGRFVWAARNSG